MRREATGKGAYRQDTEASFLLCGYKTIKINVKSTLQTFKMMVK